MIPTAFLRCFADLAGRRRGVEYLASGRASKPCATASSAVIKRAVLKALLHAVYHYWDLLGRAANVKAVDLTYSATNGGPPSGLTTLKRHQWVFRASTLGRSAGWQGSQGHMCVLL
jgi:predicted LPLAT superfamily acyltransferase